MAPTIRVRSIPTTPVVRMRVKVGQKGNKGDTGVGIGVPAGGTTGQVLSKIDNGDYATEWTTPAASAGDISFLPSGDLSSTNVQDALAELDSEKLSAAAADALFLTPAEGNAAYQPLDSDLTTLAGMARVRGDIIRGGASAWERYALGTAGYVLKSDGTDIVYAPSREKLTANRTYYVRTDGSDSNTGLANTSGAAFATMQKAVDTILDTLDCCGFSAVVQVADGTYTQGVNANRPGVGLGQFGIQIIGNASTPANCVVSTTSAACFSAAFVKLRVHGFDMRTTTSGDCWSAQIGGMIEQGGAVIFGTCAGLHFGANTGGLIFATLNYTINGNAVGHWHGAGENACIVMGSQTITLSGTPAFSAYFAGVNKGSVVCGGVTFSGSATGKRYLAHVQGTIDAGGNGETFLPGNVAGTTESGGKYVGDMNYPDAIGTLSASMGVATDASGFLVSVARREVASANVTYYVRTDGSDSNTGLANTSGGAFLTLQKAWNTLASLDLKTFTGTIEVGAGTYTAGIAMTSMPVGGSGITIRGDATTPSNVVLSIAGNAFSVSVPLPCTMLITGFKMTLTGGGRSGVVMTAPGQVSVQSIEANGWGTGFGGFYSAQIGGAKIIIGAGTAGQSITGSGPIYVSATEGGRIQFFGITVTLTGTPAFSSAFASASGISKIIAGGVTFSGSATGIRYLVTENSVIQTSGGGASYFPGDTGGSTSTGGQYA